jgi:putative Holliday junction resolvase
MRILALDYGTKRIGVALSDELKMMAHPREFLPAEPFSEVLVQLKTLIREEEVELILVGMPRNLDGTYGDSAERARQFVTVLREAICIPIRTWDERLTSVAAQRALREAGVRSNKQRSRIDQCSAAIFLQSYLDSLTLHG